MCRVTVMVWQYFFVEFNFRASVRLYTLENSFEMLAVVAEVLQFSVNSPVTPMQMDHLGLWSFMVQNAWILSLIQEFSAEDSKCHQLVYCSSLWPWLESLGPLRVSRSCSSTRLRCFPPRSGRPPSARAHSAAALGGCWPHRWGGYRLRREVKTTGLGRVRERAP